MTITELIKNAFHQHQCGLPDQLDPSRFAEFLELLNRWNQVYNLTAIRSPEEQIYLHLLDSLIVGRHLTGKNFLDVGSGGGFPGIPLAMAYPDQHWTLIDKSEKKCRFLTQSAVDLQLKNVRVVASRVELFKPETTFDGIVARAFSSLADFVQLTRHLLSEHGRWYAMKGVYPKEELAVLPNDTVAECIPLTLKDASHQRHLICIKVVK